MICEYGSGCWSKVVLLGALAVPLMVSGCRQVAPADTRAAEEQTIRGLDAQWSKAAQAHDVDGLMSFYSDDASLLPPNQPIRTGKAAIRADWVSMLAPGTAATWQATKVEVALSGDLAYLMGTYVVVDPAAPSHPPLDTGKILEVWKKQADGGWKAVVDTYNSDVAVPVAAGKKN